jgi:hypothetical protein
VGEGAAAVATAAAIAALRHTHGGAGEPLGNSGGGGGSAGSAGSPSAWTPRTPPTPPPAVAPRVAPAHAVNFAASASMEAAARYQVLRDQYRAGGGV